MLRSRAVVIANASLDSYFRAHHARRVFSREGGRRLPRARRSVSCSFRTLASQVTQ